MWYTEFLFGGPPVPAGASRGRGERPAGVQRMMGSSAVTGGVHRT